jgi:hypothetical protein
LFLTWAVGVNAIAWEYRETTWFVLGLLAAYNVAPQRQGLPSGVGHASHSLGGETTARVMHSLRS